MQKNPNLSGMFPRDPRGDRPAVHVAAAVVCRSGRPGSPWVLVARRFPHVHLPDLWEFPGGKVHEGESAAGCARREVREETGVEIAVRGLLLARDYEDAVRRVWIEFFLCEYLGGVPATIGCRAVRWVRPENLDCYRFPDANGPIIEALHARRETGSAG